MADVVWTIGHSTRTLEDFLGLLAENEIEAVADVGSWPVRLVDTAGLRETLDVVERLGIEVSERYLGTADAVLACGETEESLSLTASRVRALTEAPVIMVRTKAVNSWTRPSTTFLPSGVSR